MIRAVIADDQALARERLRDLLTRSGDVECIGEAATGDATIEVVDRAKPDVLFLDVRMPSLSGLDVARRLIHRPYIVFTTAHDQFAVTAFELQALDYLLKPFGAKRLAVALDRVRKAITERHRLDELEGRRHGGAAGWPLRRIFVRSRGGIRSVAAEDIERFEAQGDYVSLWAEGREFLIRSTMANLESQLDPDTFVRVHRSYIVNFDHVTRVDRHGSDRFAIEMRSGAAVVASRSGSRRLRARAR